MHLHPMFAAGASSFRTQRTDGSYLGLFTSISGIHPRVASHNLFLPTHNPAVGRFVRDPKGENNLMDTLAQVVGWKDFVEETINFINSQRT